MNYIDVLRDSIETSVALGLFETHQNATMKHVFSSKLLQIPMSKCVKLENFNPLRLQSSAVDAYPSNDRPRGAKDIQSVKYHQKRIRNGLEIQPIWVLKRGNTHVLLDGAHRIVALYIENRKKVLAYVIE